MKFSQIDVAAIISSGWSDNVPPIVYRVPRNFHPTKTSEQGQCGFCLSSLGILLTHSPCPHPWRHVPALKALVHDLHSNSIAQGDSSQDVWEPARWFFELHKARLEDLGGAGAWHSWSEELEFDMDDGRVKDVSDGYEYTHTSPTLHLPHLLHVLGPSSLMLYKHVLSLQWILIYTQPPIEAVCFLCQVAADMCFEDQTTSTAQEEAPNAVLQLKGKHKEGIKVLGSVMLHNIDMLKLFLEKLQYYDLIIDLTSYAPSECCATAHPGLQLTIKELPTYRLSTIHFTWSDVKLWTELDRILQLNADTNGITHACAHHASAPVWTWTDAWGVYEDVCVIWRRASYCPHDDDDNNDDDDARKYDINDEDESGAVLTRFLLSRLATVLLSTASALPDAQLTPCYLITLALGPLSSLDVHFIEWLAEEYAGGAQVSVCRGWHDLLGGLVGAAVGGLGASL
ncbi:hypothetical protein EDB87DRAFT_1835957 [Lactarius vividus]|nr:hypothetical protein EDB87DRAFT_1835957 [Lactarius vividus]